MTGQERMPTARSLCLWPQRIFLTIMMRNPLSGIYFQRELEEKAYQAAGGNIPVQLYGDFISDCTSDHFGKVQPAFRGQYGFANLRRILPEALSASFIEAMEGFGHMIKGFDCPDAILAGIESRTSSPVRIPRDETLEVRSAAFFHVGKGQAMQGGSPPRPWTASR